LIYTNFFSLNYLHDCFFCGTLFIGVVFLSDLAVAHETSDWDKIRLVPTNHSGRHSRSPVFFIRISPVDMMVNMCMLVWFLAISY